MNDDFSVYKTGFSMSQTLFRTPLNRQSKDHPGKAIFSKSNIVEIKCEGHFGGFVGRTSILLGSVRGCIFIKLATISPTSSG